VLRHGTVLHGKTNRRGNRRILGEEPRSRNDGEGRVKTPLGVKEKLCILIRILGLGLIFPGLTALKGSLMFMAISIAQYTG